jgi:hypothetical protein
MKLFAKIAGINLIILLVYSLLIRLANSGGSYNNRSMSIAVLSAFAVAAHVGVCLIAMIVAFASNKHPAGRAWLGTAGAVLVIGFSVCLGNAYV